MEREPIEAPMVFVSHASEDKNRFVIDFATKLIKKGINAWIDKWEIRPGDSLVDKIFEVGIGGAQAIIIVLSRNSVEKPWVKEELNASIVEKLKRGTKIIPVVLDDCTIPISLQSTLYVRIADLNHYDAELNSIISAIYEYSEKPSLGVSPTYIQMQLENVSGLRRIDSLLLKLAGEKAIENGYQLITTAEILSKANTLGISKYDFFESLVSLGDGDYFELHRVMGGEPSEPELRSMTRGEVPDFSITSHGFEQYARTYVLNYSFLQRDVLLQIANYNKSDSASIAETLGQPQLAVEHVFEILNSKSLLRIIREMGTNTMRFINPSPNIKRMLENS